MEKFKELAKGTTHEVEMDILKTWDEMDILNQSINQRSKENNFVFRTAESFLNSIGKSSNETNVDLAQYKAGIRVFHKKFGEGIINSVETEGEDLKVDINFEKAGHKRLMAKFAGLEIIE